MLDADAADEAAHVPSDHSGVYQNMWLPTRFTIVSRSRFGRELQPARRSRRPSPRPRARGDRTCLRRGIVLRRGGAWLGHVVKERREAHEPRRLAEERGRVDGGERVVPDVVRVMAILVNADAFEELGRTAPRRPVVRMSSSPTDGRVPPGSSQLVAHALRRYFHEDVDRLRDGALGRRVDARTRAAPRSGPRASRAGRPPRSVRARRRRRG